ncbi:hypothetical protein QVD17_29785 [Tagetes erecta]|uniref:SMAX1-like nucleotide binding domain-containing protein n=1 Tax=Tagetes erecta TaxID=13708 RepID=A0AAD8NMD2_TARER|nr:hypothetical protein QVD17_29785 [Tagetes erecta]
MKIKKLCDSIEEKIRVFDDDDDDDKGVIIDVGDLKWVVGCCESVTEMGKLVGKFAGKVWLIGYATCETFLRCQVYYPSMEIDWDLQAVPITSKSSITNIFNRMGTNGGGVGGSVQSLNSVNNLSNLDNNNWKMLMCSKCSCDYEQEVAKLKDLEVKNNLPQWLQNATTKDQSQIKDQEPVLKQKIQDLQKKWRDDLRLLQP